MAVYTNYGMIATEPSNYTAYGEGDFLFQYWGGLDGTSPKTVGEPFVISKDGVDWRRLMATKGFQKGEEYSFFSEYTNDNDVTWDLTSYMLFIDMLILKYVSTATSGTRDLQLYIMDQDDNSIPMLFAQQTASQSEAYVITSNSMGSGGLANYQTNFLPYILARPFHGSLRFRDGSSIDSNDDIQIHIMGWQAMPKMNEIVVKNCDNFCVQYSANEDTYNGNGFMTNVIPLP